MRTLYLLAAALLALPAAATGTYMGCYTAIPSDSKSMGSNTYQLSSSCSGSCSGYLYFAMSVLSGAQVCSCFNDAPLSSDEGGTCSATCNGWKEELCGGSLVWSVYAMEGVAVLVAASSAAKSTGSTAASTTAGTGSSTTAASTTGAASTAGTTADTTTGAVTGSTDTLQGAATTVLSTTTTDSAGLAVRVTVTQTALQSTLKALSTSELKSSGGGLSVVGPAVGGAVGGVAAIVVAGVVFFIWRKRRQDRLDREADEEERAYRAAFKPDPDSQLIMMGTLGAVENPFADTKPSNELSSNDDTDFHRPPLRGHRRISDGSILDSAYEGRTLGVSNPDH